MCARAQAGDEFVTHLDVSELGPVDPYLEGGDQGEDDDDDDDLDGLSGWSTELGAAGGAGAGGPLAGQLGRALEGASMGGAVHDGAGGEGAQQ